MFVFMSKLFFISSNDKFSFFFRSVFKEKGIFPAIEYSSGATVASAPDVIDSNHYRKK
jgi:hypothetical protein